MKTHPVQPARIEFSEAAVPFAPDFGDVYHARAGALAQARHVFLGGNGLPQRWQGRDRFVVLETGFGLGNNFLATWAAWRDDPMHCARLHFVSIDKHPPRRSDLAQAHASSPLAHLADQLIAAWPSLTPNLHAIDFEAGNVRLLLGFGDVRDLMPEIVAQADAFFLDGFAPSRNPAMWQQHLIKSLGRFAAPDATAATWCVARELRDGLTSAGFIVEQAPGFADKREMTVARYAPSFVPRRSPGRLACAASEREVIVIGAGLAGTSVAAALAVEGFACTVIDRHASAACESSGNPGGMLHGVVNAHDGPHARSHRAGAMHTARHVAPWLRDGSVTGRLQGLLRMAASDATSAASVIDALALPPDYVQALSAEAGSALACVPLDQAVWYYPQGGWISPAGLAKRWLSSEGVRFVGDTAVHSLQRVGTNWHALDAEQRVLAQAPLVVLANAFDIQRLLGRSPWPSGRLRGQITFVSANATGLRRPALPLAGGGYALTLNDSTVVCGATQSADDEEPGLRDTDHAYNLQQLARLTGSTMAIDGTPLRGRVGWRMTTPDRLPLIGAVPAAEFPADARLDQPRLIPREPGLFVFGALGSRGLTWAPLGARLLAAWIAGSPLPLEADLVDALDPARFNVRSARTPTPAV